jgi:F-type H+-transporting ATPase subunit b
MATAPFLASAGLLELNGTLVVELVAFILMVLILARWVYPPVARAAEARQRQIAEHLEAARREREEAEQRLREAQEQLNQARNQASEVISGANRSAEQLRAEMRQRAEEEARRIVESARKDIEAERQKAIDSVRGEVADLVVAATEKVIGESVDDARHRRLIEQAIEQVGTPGGNGAKRGG